LIISDACIGLVEAAAELFPDALWRRCVVHFYRNGFSQVPKGKVGDAARMLKAIHAQEDRRSAEDKICEVIGKLKAMRLTKAAELIEAKAHETLTYFAFPRQIRTNNPLERIIREIGRRTRVVGAFPDGHSALMLVAARLRHIASAKWGKRRYLAMETLLHPLSEEVAA
jgi:transposase-like protein